MDWTKELKYQWEIDDLRKEIEELKEKLKKAKKEKKRWKKKYLEKRGAGDPRSSF